MPTPDQPSLPFDIAFIRSKGTIKKEETLQNIQNFFLAEIPLLRNEILRREARNFED